MRQILFPERAKEIITGQSWPFQLLSLLLAALLTTFMPGCSGVQLTPGEKQERGITYSVHAGTNKGGIVENTDMNLIDGAGVDAFTGATKRGVNAGGRVSFPVGRNAAETGMDLMINHQSFSYNDPVNGYQGSRDLNTRQMVVPLTYNFRLFRSNIAGGLVHLKIGGVFQFNSVNIKGNSMDNLPGYSINRYSGGVTIGGTIFPFSFANGARLGFYADGYRGSRIYEDFYNRPEFEIPGSSYTRFGVIYQFGKRD